MAVPVIIVESETKATLLRAQLGGEMEVVVLPAAPAKASWLVPKDKLKRARPRFGFTPLPEAKPVLDRLHAVLDREMYLALDNNVQGEYWSWLLSGHLADVSKGTQVPGRLRLCGLNREEIHQGLRLVDTVREEAAIHSHIRLLLNACLGKHLDRLLGTRYAPGNLPLDFCTLTILGLLREREAELEAHRAPLKWQVRTVFTHGGNQVAARLSFAYGLSEDGFFGQVAGAKAAIELFREQSVSVQEIRREESLLLPPLPYRWPELVQESFLLHGFPPLQVARALEELAAGVQLDNGLASLIASPWSLSPAPCGPVVEKSRAFLAAQGLAAGGKENGAEPEPGSMLPLRPEIVPERLPLTLSAETRIIYAMIRERALASQMAPARIESGEVTLAAGDTCRFSAVLRRVLAPGFLDISRSMCEKDLLESSPLEHLHEGEDLAIAQIVPAPTHGNPPELYNLSSLVADLDEYGLTADPAVPVRLGRMVEAGYIELLAEGGLRPGENVGKTARVLDRALPTLTGLQLPGLMGQLAQEMATGRKPLDFGLRQLEQTLVMRGNILVKTEAAVPKPQHRSIRSIIKADGPGRAPGREAAAPPAREERGPEPSAPPEAVAGAETPAVSQSSTHNLVQAEPADGGSSATAATLFEAAPGEMPVAAAAETAPPQEELRGEDGQELGNAGEPFGVETADAEELAELAAAIPAEAAEAFLPEEEAADGGRRCPTCGQPLVHKEDRFGAYVACSGFPACRYVEAGLQEERVMACPLCRQGSIMATRAGSGRTIYVCRSEGCEFLAWSRPHAGTCPACKAPYLIEMKKADGGIVLGCPRNGCGYRQEGEEGLAGQAAPDAPRKMVRVRVVKRAGAAAAGKRKVVVVRRKK